jgi:hypothetical protein
MKEVTYLPGIRREKELLVLAERATAQLDEILKNFAPLISAEWDASDDRGRIGITLRIWDDIGSEMMARFQAAELKDPDQMHNRLFWLWDDLLAVRSRQFVKRLEAMYHQYEGG